MYFSERVTNELALKSVMEQKRNLGEIVEVDDFFQKGRNKISVTIGSKTFSAEGDDALKKLTVKVKNHKPSLVKRRFGKIIKNVFNRRELSF